MEEKEKMSWRALKFRCFFPYDLYLALHSKFKNPFRASDDVVEKSSYQIGYQNDYDPNEAFVSFICLHFQTINSIIVRVQRTKERI